MSKIFKITPIFLDVIPKELEEGKLYISLKFKTAIHLCACGCGGQAVTPFGRWQLSKNNDKITLRPSIGNWNGQSPYHAHYYITDNLIDWL